MPLIIALWLLSQPLVVQAPINGLLTERLITIQGNSVVGATSHLNPPRFNSLGVLGDFTDKVVVLHELELAAQKYGYKNVNKLLSVLFCESSLDNSKTGKAGEIGIAQFMPKTWDWFNKIRGTNLDIYNELDQIDMLVWSIANGYSSHWTCY